MVDGCVQEKRDLIMQEFYTTEQQYVEALKMLVEVNSNLIKCLKNYFL